jgi:glucose/arabinose dehydrogenase
MTSPFSSCPLAALAEAIVPEAFCAFEIPVQMNRPRMILAIGASSLLALERGTGSVILVEDSDQDGVPDSRRLVVSANGLSYGLALHDGFIYALSDQAVFRWSYESTSEDRIANIGAQETVVDNINMNGQGSSNTGNHSTRTLAFDAQGRLYVSVGSVGNVDVNSSRSRIRRFSDLTPSLFPIDFLQGEVFADGVRNEVGLAFDRHGILWGAENGADNLQLLPTTTLLRKCIAFRIMWRVPTLVTPFAGPSISCQRTSRLVEGQSGPGPPFSTLAWSRTKTVVRII